MDFLDHEFKFSSLLTEFPSATRLPLRKCCRYDEFFSFIDEKCVSVNVSSVPDPRPNSSEFRIEYGLSCLLPNPTITFSNLRDFVKMKKIFGNGSLDVLFGSAEKLMHLEWDDYCFDVEKEMLNPLLLSCQPAEAVGNKRASFLFVFYLSLVLWIVTFSLYLVRPDLRKRVHDKCFICCMGFGVLSLALAALRAEYGFRLRGKCWGP